MQMKRNTKFRAVDLAIIIICLAGSIISGTAFLLEYNRTLTKLNEEPIATVVFKRRTAQRKFIDRVVWDRLKQASFVYNGDTIRTIEMSEATITFKDEVTYLALYEKTMIQVFYDDIEGARISFSGGNLEVISTTGNVLITSGSSSIVVDGQTSLNKDDDGLNISVTKGQASHNGERLSLGSILSFNSRGERNTTPAIAMTSFGSSARVVGVEGQPVPVVFAWNAANFAPDTHVIVEVALDRGFQQILETRDVSSSSVPISMENGSYYWRAYPAAGDSAQPISRSYPNGSLNVFSADAPTLLTPVRAEEFASTESSRVSFSWSAVENASAYILEVSSNANMSAPVVSRRVWNNSVTQTGLGASQYYWRVTPVFPDRINGSSPASVVSDFSIVQTRPVLTEPVLTQPLQNGKMYIDSSSHRLVWLNDRRADSWTVEIADNPNMNNPVRQNVTANYYSLPDEYLQSGKRWYWRVTALGGASPAVSIVRNFEISEGSILSSIPIISMLIPAPEPVQPETSAPEPVPAVSATPAPVRPPVSTTPTPPPVQPPVSVTPTPVQPPVSTPAPPPVQPTPVAPESTLERLLRETGTGAIKADHMENVVITTGQLQHTSSVTFDWEGGSSPYRFALYHADGREVISPVDVQHPYYELTNPNILTPGEYVWQVFERNGRGGWNDLPTKVSRFVVSAGQIPTLQTQSTGELYGHQ